MAGRTRHTKDGGFTMIILTRLSGSQFVLNADLVERIDETPDTVVTLSDGTKYVVTDSMRSVLAKIRLHRAEIIALSEHVQVSADVPADELSYGGYDRVTHLAVVGAEHLPDGASS